MNQLNAGIAVAMKYAFWIICGVVVMLSLGSWYMARNNLKTEFNTNLTGIEGKYTTLQTLQKKPFHANKNSHDGMDKINQQLLQSVFNAWEKQYSQQTRILEWPPELMDDFVTAVRPLTPIELKVKFPTPVTEEIKVDFRQRYANYVERLLPRLSEVIGAKWMAKSASAGMGMMGMPTSSETPMPDSGMAGMPGMPGGPPGKPAEKPPIVVWSSGDQGMLLANHFDWSKQQDSAPTTLQVLYAQEDLWVLRALMFIIRAANGEIDSRHEAVVKTIESIQIGRDAAGRAGQVTLLRGGGMGGTGEGSMMTPGYGSPEAASMMGSASSAPSTGTAGPTPMAAGSGSSSPMMPGPTTPGMGMTGAGAVSMDPANFRYVGNDYMPLPAEKIRSAMKSENPEDAFFVVAKRMPIRMRLQVDQRKLHRLLTECGNSRLTVEIRQVRINRKGSGGGGMESYGVSPGYGMPSMGPDLSGMGMMSEMSSAPGYSSESNPMTGMGMGMGGGDLSKRTIVSSTTSNDLPVELWGIIYIYNPVDRERLGIQAGEAPVAASPTTKPVAGA
jgi:hypothetical protein